MASTVSASDERMRRSDARLRFVPDFVNPPLYVRSRQSRNRKHALHLVFFTRCTMRHDSALKWPDFVRACLRLRYHGHSTSSSGHLSCPPLRHCPWRCPPHCHRHPLRCCPLHCCPRPQRSPRHPLHRSRSCRPHQHCHLLRPRPSSGVCAAPYHHQLHHWNTYSKDPVRAAAAMPRRLPRPMKLEFQGRPASLDDQAARWPCQ